MELLANKIRPTKLSEVIGQEHLIGEDKILSNLINNNNIDLTKLDDNNLNTVLNYGIRNYLNNGIESFYIDYKNINNK